MFVISQSPIRFMERRGLIQTARAPVPRVAPDLCAVHNMPLKPPLPDPLLLQTVAGIIPDRGLTTQWPHGEAGEAGISS